MHSLLRLFTEADHAAQLHSKRTLGRELPTQFCYSILLEGVAGVDEFYALNQAKLDWLLTSCPWETDVSRHSRLEGRVVEIGPNPWQRSAFCSNALGVLETACIQGVLRIERSRLYQIDDDSLSDDDLLHLLGDRMTERVFSSTTLHTATVKARLPIEVIDVLQNGRDAIVEANQRLGLALDEEDIDYYTDLFRHKMKRDPTDAELCDLAQSDSEHSRHWFFRGRLTPESGVGGDRSLMSQIKESIKHSNKNNLIAFSDNSSAIHGFSLPILLPSRPYEASELVSEVMTRHLVYTAETHNFPTAVCPFEGAATGTGGRIRDVHATGRGAQEIAAVAGYSFGCLNLPGYSLPWEDHSFSYPSCFALPSQIAVEASNGASDYGNKFGEPVICGFARSFGLRFGSRRVEYLKPIMFSGGIGSIADEALYKEKAAPDMVLAKIGGPAYRIGVGGGAASSVAVQGSRADSIDYSAVQRGDAQMGQKLHRLVRSCAEMGAKNPILAIHDQGAGGNGNVLKEIIEGCGAVIEADRFLLGDDTLSFRELWTAEYQENDAILVSKEGLEVLKRISERENCPVTAVGHLTHRTRMLVQDFSSDSDSIPIDYDLRLLGERDQKTFHRTFAPLPREAFLVPENLSVKEAFHRVLRLPSVASKRYLTSKVDRSVTGLVAQQQCVGPLQTPLADVAVVSLSYYDVVGAAVAVGEQPVKMLASTESGCEMTLAECLTNLVFAPISDLKDVKLSGNWMWSRDEDCGRLAEAVRLLCQAMAEVGVAIDGGKDSLSMKAATATETVTAPGTLVLSAYVKCTDVRNVVTPHLKGSRTGDTSVVLYVRMDGREACRLGGTALAQCCSQVGSDAARVESWKTFSRVFEVIQKAVKERRLLAGHDVSDGGVLVALAEMAFAGNVHVEANFTAKTGTFEALFNEESALLLEVEQEEADRLASELEPLIGRVPRVATVHKVYGPEAKFVLSVNGKTVLEEWLIELREVWEDTSLHLDLLQTDPECVHEAREHRKQVKEVFHETPFDYGNSFSSATPSHPLLRPPKVMILREEGSNGDREMAAAFNLAGFTAFDVTMNDLLRGGDGCSLEAFDGIAFVGGFSHGDVLGAAKGWASRIKYHPELSLEMERFRHRSNSFSIGVCNGCQLMTSLGWVGELDERPCVSMAANRSGRFESAFVSVRVADQSRAKLLQGMNNAVLGIWTSHGEGRFTFSDDSSRERLASCIALQYADENGQPTESYPCNPNGSWRGIAAMCSEDGRHLAMMPHADRSYLTWQLADDTKYLSPAKSLFAPWIRLFQNAAEFVRQRESS